MAIAEASGRRLIDEVAEAFVALGTRRHEALDRMRELYDAQVSFEDPIQRVEGLTAFIDLNRRLLRRTRRITVDVSSRVGTDEEFVLVWRMQLRPRLGPLLEVHGTSHFRAASGRVVAQHDYWDLGELAASSVPFGRRLLRLLLRPLA